MTISNVPIGTSTFTLNVAIPACVATSGVTLSNQAFLSNIQAMPPYHANTVVSDDINTAVFPNPPVTQITCVEICYNGTDDDGDGLVDCADSDCTASVYGVTVTSQTGVTSSANATGAPNSTNAQLYDSGDIITLDLGVTIPSGKTITIRWKKPSGFSTSPAASVQWSANNSSYTTFAGSPFTVSSSAYVNQNLTTVGNTRYIRISTTNSGDLDLDVISTSNCTTEICNNAIDDDGDGLVDCADASCSAPVASAGPDQTICSGGSVVLSASASGATGPYSYTWSNGLGNGATVVTTPASTTTYTVSVSTANSCIGSGHEVVVTVVNDPNITAQPTGFTECIGGTQALSVTATGGTPSITYQWQSSTDNVSFTDLTGATSATYTPASTVAGTTYFRVIISASGNGCGIVTSNSVPVIIANDPSITTHPSNTMVCSGGAATLSVTATGGGSSLTYQWQSGITASGPWVNILGATASTYTTLPLIAIGNYRVIVSATGNGCGSATSNVATVSIGATLAASITGTNTICAGGSTVLTGNGGTSYVWSTGSTAAAINVSPASTTTYTVTVTGLGGCTATATRTVTVNPEQLPPQV